MEVGSGSGRRRDRDGDREEREGEERGVTSLQGPLYPIWGKSSSLTHFLFLSLPLARGFSL